MFVKLWHRAMTDFLYSRDTLLTFQIVCVLDAMTISLSMFFTVPLIGNICRNINLTCDSQVVSTCKIQPTCCPYLKRDFLSLYNM